MKQTISRLCSRTSAGLLLSFGMWHADAQLRLYDAKRDAAAQEAKRTVDKIQSGDLFKKQAHNLQTLTERDVATTVADAKIEMQTAINAFITWSDIESLIHDVETHYAAAMPPPDTKALQTKLDAQRTALTNEIANIQKAAGSGANHALDNLANSVGQFESGLKFANEQLHVNQAAVSTTIDILDQLQTLYKAYQDQMQAVDEAVSKLQDLKVELKKALLGRLKVEEDYLLAKVALYERRDKEIQPIRLLIKSYKLPPGVGSDDRIDETLQRLAANDRDLHQAVQSVFIGAALASRGRLPDRLYNLRVAELEHLRSIQLSAANARVYETILGGGVERLALFYQGGIKPETLAQIAQSLATTGIFGKIVTQ